MSALTKRDLYEPLAEKYDSMTQQSAKQLVENFFDIMKDTLVDGKQIKLSGFGNFTLRDKVARPGRNPKTMEDIEITARRVVTFRPGNKLRNRVEKGPQK